MDNCFRRFFFAFMCKLTWNIEDKTIISIYRFNDSEIRKTFLLRESLHNFERLNKKDPFLLKIFSSILCSYYLTFKTLNLLTWLLCLSTFLYFHKLNFTIAKTTKWAKLQHVQRCCLIEMIDECLNTPVLTEKIVDFHFFFRFSFILPSLLVIRSFCLFSTTLEIWMPCT